MLNNFETGGQQEFLSGFYKVIGEYASSRNLTKERLKTTKVLLEDQSQAMKASASKYKNYLIFDPKATYSDLESYQQTYIKNVIKKLSLEAINLPDNISKSEILASEIRRFGANYYLFIQCAMYSVDPFRHVDPSSLSETTQELLHDHADKAGDKFLELAVAFTKNWTSGLMRDFFERELTKDYGDDKAKQLLGIFSDLAKSPSPTPDVS